MKKVLNDYLKILKVLVIVVAFAYILMLRQELEKKPTEIVKAETIIETVTEVEEKEVVKPYVITEQLPEDFNHRKEMIHMYFRHLGESEENIKVWDHIIEGESKYNPNSKAPTYWSLCSDGSFKELTSGDIRLQDTCENHGLETVRTGYSEGLLHIIDTTRESHGCNITDWMSELECSVKVKNQSGFEQWATYYNY